jgi:anti-anti-sigma regulatory factor
MCAIARHDRWVLMCPAARQEGRNVVLDLTQVDAIDVAEIGGLVSLQATGVYLKLMPPQQVRDTLKVTNLDSIFEICESHSTCGTTGLTQAGGPNKSV